MLGDDERRIQGRRRSVLAGIAGAASVATAGCQEFRSIANRTSSKQVELEVKTVPADVDPRATHIARTVTDHLQAVGVDAAVTPMTEQELLRDVLINNAFDLYVARHPGYDDPDFLRPLLHSRFAEEPGWQNPFGFTDLDVDELLDAQRRVQDGQRSDRLAALQRRVARHQPLAVVAFPDDIWGVRTDRFVGWERFGLGRSLGYLALDDVDGRDRLTVVVTDDRLTKNLNPIAAEFRGRGTFTGLLYDSLGRRYGGGVEPWLAERWEWLDRDEHDGLTARVHLREDARWHDGPPVTAEDVAFTYEFLTDTSLGREEGPVPAPRFRGRVSLVDRVTPVNDRTVEVAVAAGSRTVAERVFTVPILPRREWESKAAQAAVAGIGFDDRTTEAVVWNNPQPVGSGPLRFEEKEAEERVVLSRFDDHFLHADRPGETSFGAAFEQLSVQVAPSDSAAVELLGAGQADATASALSQRLVPEIARRADVNLVAETSRSFYHLGFNVQRTPLGNPRFRRNVARLLDKEAIVAEVFDGYATPAATPLEVTDFAAADLVWEGEDPVLPFFGSDGDLAVERAKEAFRKAGYRYSDSGELVSR
ncbi:ABC transporter substrate-binding protein [Halomicrococcus sp. NG-SE-24]|uniref:ABC transporter substrate-binding protein n=1 Tax=Halomicrococcus sp. NG-SE-24 TaxID=3436928 RepID=UPI003D97BC03